MIPNVEMLYVYANFTLKGINETGILTGKHCTILWLKTIPILKGEKLIRESIPEKKKDTKEVKMENKSKE